MQHPPLRPWMSSLSAHSLLCAFQMRTACSSCAVYSKGRAIPQLEARRERGGEASQHKETTNSAGNDQQRPTTCDQRMDFQHRMKDGHILRWEFHFADVAPWDSEL